MFLPGCDAILDYSIWGHARYMYTSAIYVSYIYDFYQCFSWKLIYYNNLQ